MAPSYMSQSEPERKTWPNKLEYHMVLCCQALGLSSFWRFPYLASENGGAPFVYVFLLLYLVVGVPLVFLEMAWGQYSNLAPPQGFSIIPIMQGVGWCMLLLALAVIFYCGAASYYFLLYLASSMAKPLPFSSCNNTWNTVHCQTDFGLDCVAPGSESLEYRDGRYGVSTHDGQFIQRKLCTNTTNSTITTPTIEYWKYNLASDAAICQDVQTVTDILFGSSSPLLLPMITIGIFVAVRLILAFFSLLSEVRFTGKVAYGLFTIPFAVLVLLLVRCLTLSKASTALSYLFVPDNLQSFLSPKLWKDAISQVFFSLMITWGGLCTWASYNRFYNRYEVDAAILIVTVPLLSLLPTISVYAVIGHLTYVQNIPFEKALDGIKGPLAPIVAYSEALSQMWGDPVPWSIAIFTCFFLLSTSAMLPAVECLVSSVSDSISSCRAMCLRVISVLLVLLFTLIVYFGVPCIVQDGALQYFEFFDTFAFPVSCMLIAFPELLMITYAFGIKLLRTNIKAMTNNSCLKRLVWPVLWGGVTPFVITGCLVYTLFGVASDGLSSLAPELPEGVSRMRTLKGWTAIGSYVFVGVIFAIITINIIWKIARARGNCLERLRDVSTPAALGRSSVHTNGSGRGGRSNGDLYMADYVGHRDANEILVDDDMVTTV